MSVTNSFLHNKKKMDVPQPENEKKQPKSCKKKKKLSHGWSSFKEKWQT